MHQNNESINIDIILSFFCGSYHYDRPKQALECIYSTCLNFIYRSNASYHPRRAIRSNVSVVICFYILFLQSRRAATFRWDSAVQTLSLPFSSLNFQVIDAKFCPFVASLFPHRCLRCKKSQTNDCFEFDSFHFHLRLFFCYLLLIIAISLYCCMENGHPPQPQPEFKIWRDLRPNFLFDILSFSVSSVFPTLLSRFFVLPLPFHRLATANRQPSTSIPFHPIRLYSFRCKVSQLISSHRIESE